MPYIASSMLYLCIISARCHMYMYQQNALTCAPSCVLSALLTGAARAGHLHSDAHDEIGHSGACPRQADSSCGRFAGRHTSMKMRKSRSCALSQAAVQSAHHSEPSPARKGPSTNPRSSTNPRRSHCEAFSPHCSSAVRGRGVGLRESFATPPPRSAV